MSVEALSVSEAKASFSSLIQQVCDNGDFFIIKKRGKPVARIVPVAAGGSPKAAGSLARYAKKGVVEEGAFEAAMAVKHASAR